MRIDVSDIRILTDRLLSRIEEMGYRSMDIPYDYYYDIIGSDRYDVGTPASKAVQKLVVGSLSDDRQVVEDILKGRVPDALVALVNISALLRAVGDNVNQVFKAR